MKLAVINFGNIVFEIEGDILLGDFFNFSKNFKEFKKIHLIFKEVKKSLFDSWVIKKIKENKFLIEFINNSQPFFHQFLLTNTIQFIGTKEILKSGGIVLHGAGISHNSKGYAFLAESSGGKSTLAKNFGENGILSDEFVIISKYPEKQGFFIFPEALKNRDLIKFSQTPVILKEIYFILKSPKLYIENISFKEAFFLLLKHTVCDKNLWNYKKILKNASKILKKHKFLKLYFNEKDSIWKLLKD